MNIRNRSGGAADLQSPAGRRLMLRRVLPIPDSLQRYVTGEYLFSFLISFLFFLAIFFVNQILVIARDRLAEHVSVFDTLRLIIYAMPAIIALSVPYASFIGIILAIGKLSEGREILAARASGVSFRRLLSPVLISALFLSSLSFITNDYFLPLGTMNYSRLFQELLYSNSRLIIEPYSVRHYENSTLVTGAVEDHLIDGLLILDSAEDGSRRTISATRAELARNDNKQGIITLKLSDVEILSTKDDIVQESYAESMDYNILLENIVLNVGNPSVREMSARDVYSLIQDREKQFAERLASEKSNYLSLTRQFESSYFDLAGQYRAETRTTLERNLRQLPATVPEQIQDRTLRLYQLEFWKKFSIPLASLTFIFMGFPLGLMALKHGRTLGIVLGLILAAGYWGMLTANEALGMQLSSIPAAMIAFWPNVVMLTAGSILLYGYFKS